ncbi:uncharacterized protein [Penaeus vannamei]|uniref:uncharacterized protein n=1 Tax=Penaeus vannamei TaxID=6689 RepID=UPI00387F840F
MDDEVGGIDGCHVLRLVQRSWHEEGRVSWMAGEVAEILLDVGHAGGAAVHEGVQLPEVGRHVQDVVGAATRADGAVFSSYFVQEFRTVCLHCVYGSRVLQELGRSLVSTVEEHGLVCRVLLRVLVAHPIPDAVAFLRDFCLRGNKETDGHSRYEKNCSRSPRKRHLPCFRRKPKHNAQTHESRFRC